MLDARKAREISAENDIDKVMFNEQVKYCEEVIAEAARRGKREAIFYQGQDFEREYRRLAVEVLRERGFEINEENESIFLGLWSTVAYVVRW